MTDATPAAATARTDSCGGDDRSARGVVAMAVAAELDPVTREFMAHPGGYFVVDDRLFRLLGVPSNPNERLVPVEDCSLPPIECAVRMAREDVMRGRVAKWPDALK